MDTVSVTVTAPSSCAPPTNLQPPSGTIYISGTTGNINLSWSDSSGASNFNVRLDDGTSDRYDDPRYTTCASPSPHYYCENGITTTSITNVPVKAGRTYTFWIDPNYNPPRNYCNNSTVFTVQQTPPGPASLISPNGTICTNSPEYKWNAVSNATYYLLWVDDSTTLAAESGKIRQWYTAAEAGCASGVGTCSVTSATPHSFNTVDSLGMIPTGYNSLAGGAAKWYIQTYNVAGRGPKSPYMNFKVLLPPTLLPSSCPLPGTSASLSWNPSNGATFYALRVDNLTNGWTGTCATVNPGDVCTNVSATSYSFSSSPGANYNWWVHACDASVCCDSF